MAYVAQLWKNSKAFRTILIIVIVFTSLRLLAQVYMMTARMLPGQSETQIIPNDMQDYIDAGIRLQNREFLYPISDDYGKFFQYSPMFALAISPFVRIPPAVNLAINFVLRLVGYAVLYILWGRIFRRAKWTRATELLAWSLPLWMIFSAFWSDLAYMNIYIITAMFSTLLIDSILGENLFWSVVWLTILLHTKPFWAFPMAIPLLLGRRKFFLRLIIATIIANIAAVGIFLLAVGPPYGLDQLAGFFKFLGALNSNFPWRGPEAGLLGYNHSITQIVVFLFGVSPASFNAAVVIKVILLIPLAIIAVKNLLRPVKKSGYEVPELALGLAFGLYLGVFIWVDMVWEVSLGCAAFVYLLAMVEKGKVSKALLWIVFLPYALIDLWQILSFAVMGDAAFVADGEYIVTDYSYFIPIMMIVILVFYGITVMKLWNYPHQSSITP
jgi:hypothetical protein